MILPLAQAKPTGLDALIERLLGLDRFSLKDSGQISLDFLNPIPPWVFVLVVVPAIVALVWAVYRRERKDLGAGVRVFLCGLRAALFLLVIGLLLGPVLTLEVVTFRRAYVLVLVDDSLSMRKGDPPTRLEDQLALAKVTNLWDKDEKLPDEVRSGLLKLSRADVVREALKNPTHEFTDQGQKHRHSVLEELERKLNVAYFTFSKGARAVESRDVLLSGYTTEACLGTETAIGDSVKQAMSMFKGALVAGVIIVSDGRNNLGIEPEQVATQLRQRYVPIFTVCPGIPQKVRDVALLEPEAKQAVRANDIHAVKFTVRSEGLDGEEIDLSMHVYPFKPDDETKDWQTMDPAEVEKVLADATTKTEATKKFVLKEGPERLRDEMTWQPKTKGHYLVIVRTPPREGERTHANNQVVVPVRVIDDKLRVLFVDHPPRFEYRYLKNALIRDPKVLCHVLLTSADENFPQEVSIEATEEKFKAPLKEFPKDLKELVEYDVIILGDVDPQRLGGRETLENIRRFVTDFGGGLLLVSGVMNNPRNFKGTPLEDCLPVFPEETKMVETVTGSYQYALTDYAKAEGGHPIIRFPAIGKDLPKLIEQWEDKDKQNDGLVGIRWYAPAKPKSLAQVIVEVAGVQGQDVPGKRPPLFAVMNYGKGRVFWSGTDETWLWRFRSGDHPWFYPFWQQAMYWAMDRKLTGAQRYQLYLNKHEKRYVMGEPVLVTVHAYNKDFHPLQDPELEIFIEPPQGQRLSLKLVKDKEKDGHYEGSFQPRDPGSYRIWAGEEDETTRSVDKFVVYIPNREEDEPILDIPVLKRLAVEAYPDVSKPQETKEQHFFPITELKRLPETIQASPQAQSRRTEDELWDAPLIYILFALFITTEWVLRKIFRML